MRWLAIAAVLALVTACSGGSSGSPTAPTTTATISGSYNLTITAASSCSANLPPETRVLNYIADISQTGTSFTAGLLAHAIFNTFSVSGTVSGQTVTFSPLSFSEITTGGGIALASSGTATVASNGSMSGTVSGNYQTPSGASCNATNHQIQLVKR